MSRVRYAPPVLLLLLFAAVAFGDLRAQSPAGKEFVIVLPTLMEFSEMQKDIANFSIEVYCQRHTNISFRWADGSPIVNAQAEANTRSVFMRPMFQLWQIMQSPFDFDAEKPNRRAFIISADQPVSVHALFDTAYRTESYAVYPVSSYDTAYTVVNHAGYGASSGRSGFVVMASQDGTDVTITPSAQTWKGNQPGVPYTVRLDRYQVCQVVSTFKSSGRTADITGTTIRANKPVGVLSFSSGCNVPTFGPPAPPSNPPGSGNIPEYSYSTKLMIEHQAPEAWAGTTFYTLPFVRKEPLGPQPVNRAAREPGKIGMRADTSLVRLVALQFGTTFDTNGVRITKKAGGDSLFSRNDMLDVRFTGPMKITSSKPVLAMQLAYSSRDCMTYDTIFNVGNRRDTVDIRYGDPAMAYLPPVSQYQANLQVTVPNVSDRPAPDLIQGISIFWKHYLIVTAPAAAAAKVRVNGNPVNFAYQQSGGAYVSAYVRVFPGQRELIESPEPVSVISYGLTWADSYASTSAESARSFARATPDTLRFFSCSEEKDTAITLSNTGVGDFQLDSVRISGVVGSVLAPTPLPRLYAGKTQGQILITFKTPVPGVYTGSIRLFVDANNASVITVPFVITRDSAKLALPATTIDFGLLKAAQTQRDTLIVVRNDGDRPLVLDAASIVGTGYQLIGATLPDTLAPRATDTLHIRFLPTGDGLREATLRISGSPCLQPVNIVLRGFKGSGATALVQRVLQYESYLCDVPASVDSVILFRSIGDEPITISSSSLGGINRDEFLLLDSLTGVTIPPGDTLRFRVRYVPQGNGERRAVLSLTTNAKNAPQINIDLIARKDTVSLIPTADSLRFGTVLSCGDTLERTLTIRNTGTVADTITAADLGGATAFAIGTSLPIVLNPFTSQDIRVRFVPPSDGSFPVRLHLTGTPCNVEATVWLSGERTSPSIAVAPIRFDTVFACQAEQQRAMVITNNGTLPDTVISAADPSGVFRLLNSPFPMVIAPGASETLMVRFIPPAAGSYSSVVSLQWGPCAGQLDVPVEGVSVAPAFALSAGGIDFGTVNINTPARDTLVVRNNGAVPRTVSAATFGSPGSVRLIRPAALPANIAPGDSLEIELEYLPTAKGVLQTTLTLRIADPCGGDTTIALSGTAVGDEIVETSFTVAMTDASGGVDSEVELPIVVENWATVAAAAPTAMRLVLSYRYTLLEPLAVVSSLSGTNAQVVSATVNQADRVVLVDLTGTNFPTNGELARLRCRVLLGDTDRTALRVDSVSITTPPNRQVTVQRRNGEFQTLGICRTGGDRYVRLGGLRLKSVLPNPSRDAVAINFENDRDDVITVNMYDAYGNLVRALAPAPTAAGVHTIRFDTRAMASGLYVCEIGNGRQRARTTLIVAQ